MKTSKILLVILLGLSLSSFSQNSDHGRTGKFFFETNFRGGSMGDKDWILNFRPTIGKFVTENWAVGITSKLEFVNQRLEEGIFNEITKANSLQSEIGVFTQYYLSGGLYVKLSATMGNSHTAYTGRPDWNKFSYTVSPEIGYDYYFGKKKRIAIGASVSYDFGNIDSGYGEVEYPIPFMHNFSGFRFNLTIKFILNKKAIKLNFI